MSHFTTHHIFGQQVLRDAASDTARLVEENLPAFCWGLQGADLLYNHRQIDGYSELPLYGRMIHGEKTNTLFTFLAHDLINHRKCADFDLLMAYYYGFCCHYALDCKCHPYVFSLQKRLEDASADWSLTAGSHRRIEDGMDCELSEALVHFCPAASASEDYYIADRSVHRTISGLYSRILWNVYEKRVQAKTVEECFADGIWRTDLIYDAKGMLKPYAIMNRAVLQACPDACSYFANVEPTTDDCLNLKHVAWFHHGDRQEHDESVIDLMMQGKELALTLWNLSAHAVKQGNRHLITNFDFSRSFVDGKFR